MNFFLISPFVHINLYVKVSMVFLSRDVDVACGIKNHKLARVIIDFSLVFRLYIFSTAKLEAKFHCSKKKAFHLFSLLRDFVFHRVLG